MRLVRAVVLMMTASAAVVAIGAALAFGCAPGPPMSPGGAGSAGAVGGAPARDASAGSSVFPGAGATTGATSGGTRVPGMPISPRDAIERARSAGEQAEIKQVETVCHVYLAEQGLPDETVKVLSYDFENGRATAQSTGESGGYAVTMYLERPAGGQWEVRSHTGP